MSEPAHILAAAIKSKAKELGFNLVGITSAQPPDHLDYFRQWLDTGNAGNMWYLRNRFSERADPATYFPGTRSIVCVAVNYHVQLDPPADSESGKEFGRVARYALGNDYHTVLTDRLHRLADWLRGEVPGAQTRCGVDTAPIMEKELAARAGNRLDGKKHLHHSSAGRLLSAAGRDADQSRSADR